MGRQKKLNIAIVSPFEYATPPPREVIRAPQWLNYFLSCELKRRGHNVVLIAPRTSKTKAKLEHFNLKPLASTNIYPHLIKKDFNYKARAVQIYNTEAYARLYNNASRFDIMHAIFVPEILPFASKSTAPTLCTIHNIPKDIETFFIDQHHKAGHIYFNSISRRHSTLFPKSAKHIGTVYNGINLNDYKFRPGGEALIFVGRMLRVKGPHTAISVAQKVGKRLKIFGEIPYDHTDFWKTELEPHLGKKIQYKGQVSPPSLSNHYGNSKILLFPIEWEEAFGLVMIEAMACGTPVVAFNRGAVPEVIKDGETGFVVENKRQMVSAVKKIYNMPKDGYAAMRRACRKHIEENFSVERMVDNYENMYYKIISSS